MCRLAKYLILVFLFSLTILSTRVIEGLSDEFLLVYRDAISLAHRDAGFTYLMKFNSKGQVLTKPQSIAPELRDSFDGCTISWAQPGLNIWISMRNPHYPHGPDYITERLTVSQRDLSTLSIHRVHVDGSGSFLSITNKPDQNFILFATNKGDAIAAGIDRHGSMTGQRWPLNRKDEITNSSPIVSNDGRIVAWLSKEGLVLQGLDQSGRPTHLRNVLRKYKNYPLNFLGITNVLPGQKRFLLITGYLWRTGSCSGATNLNTLLAIDEHSLDRMYSSFDYRTPGECGAQLTEIDPEGRFILQTDFGFHRGNLDLEYPVLYQALDESGHRTGAVKPIAENAPLGFSMLPS